MDDKILNLKLSKGYCYLLSTNDGYMLIDTGYEYDLAIFENEMSKHGLNYADFKYIFLTHHHDDHSGLVNYIVDRNPKITVIMHNSCKDLIRIGENDRTNGGGYINRRMYFLSKLYKIIHPKWTLTFPPYFARESDIIFRECDTNLLRGLGISGKLIYSPGHTTDSVGILLDNGNYFAGDSAANFLNFAGAKNCPVFISNVREYYKSWERIIESGALMIFPTHGLPFSVENLKKNLWKIKEDGLLKFF